MFEVYPIGFAAQAVFIFKEKITIKYG